MVEPVFTSYQTVETRKSAKERRLIPTMLELKQQEASQRESKFTTLYEKWKEQVKTSCTKLKVECSDEVLGDMMDAVEGLETQVKDAYGKIQSHSAPCTEFRRKMDFCTFKEANESTHE